MKITVLGTGTSQGIPVIGCDCQACRSTDSRDQRWRTSLHVSVEDVSIVIDTGPDFRAQMLANDIRHIDAILFTHEHNDHVIGLDDVRPFNFKQKQSLPIYGLERVVGDIKSRFLYAFADDSYPGAPKLVATSVENDAFFVKNQEIIPIPIFHGDLAILGYKIQDLVYLTDIKTISKSEIDKIRNTKILIISALRNHPHHSHLSLSEALELIEQISPERTYLTHLSHEFGPVAKWESTLPANVSVAYDGQVIQS